MPSTQMQASLPMYDFPETRQANEAWWQGIAKHMRQQGIEDVPQNLMDESAIETLWTNPNLLMSQCCGFDVMNSYKDHLSVLMISNWDVEGCEPNKYCSFIVVHEDNPAQTIDQLRGSAAVINGPESHSGMNALFSSVQPFSVEGQFFKEIHISEAHLQSLRFIQNKQADVAAIDNVTFAILKRYRPTAVEGVRVLCHTMSAPALPYVTAINTSRAIQQKMQTALKAAFRDPELAAVREALLLKEGAFPDLSGDTHPYSTDANPYREIAEGFTFDAQLLEPIIKS